MVRQPVDCGQFLGEWCDNWLIVGNGCIDCLIDYCRVVGSFSNPGKMHGKGQFKWGGGDEYDGEWRDGEMHGTGCADVAGVDQNSGALRI